MSHKVSLQLELFAAVADIASESVKGNSSFDNVTTSEGLESSEKNFISSVFESLLVTLPMS
jgi:hypothetical protein